MKLELATTSLFLAATQAVALPWPQFGGGGGLKLVGQKEGKPVYRQNAKRVTLKYGPLTLAGKDQKKPAGSGMSMDPKGQGGITTISGGICSDCTILSGHFKLTNAADKEMGPKNGVYIHHMVSFDSSKKVENPIGSCGGGLGGLGGIGGAAFIDRGEDSGQMETVFTSQDGKFNSGYHMGKSKKFTVQYDLVNYKDTAQELYLNLEYEYVPGIVGKDAGHSLKSVTGCGAVSPKLSQTGPAVTTSGKMPINADASIVWVRGHLHAGGDKMTLFINDKKVCESFPTYDKEGVITKMSLCPEIIKVKKGDYMTISSTYDLSKHKLRASTDGHGSAHGRTGGSDVMGMMAMTFART